MSNFLRVSKWMIGGSAIAANPANKAALRNAIGTIHLNYEGRKPGIPSIIFSWFPAFLISFFIFSSAGSDTFRGLDRPVHPSVFDDNRRPCRVPVQVAAKGIEPFQIRRPQPRRIDEPAIVHRFQIVELRGPMKRKLDLLRREHVKQQHLVFLCRKCLSASERLCRSSKQSERMMTSPRRRI